MNLLVTTGPWQDANSDVFYRVIDTSGSVIATVGPNGTGFVPVAPISRMCCPVGLGGSGVVDGAGLAVDTTDLSGNVTITVACNDVKDCMAPVFAPTGFSYDTTNRVLKPSSGISTGSVLTVTATGVATFVPVAPVPLSANTGAGSIPLSGSTLTINGTGLVTTTVSGSTFQVSVTQEDVQTAIGSMFTPVGLVYDNPGNTLRPVASATAGQVLTIASTGIASWQTPGSGSSFNIAANSGVAQLVNAGDTLTVNGLVGSVITTSISATDTVSIGFDTQAGGNTGTAFTGGNYIVSNDGKYHQYVSPIIAGQDCVGASLGSVSFNPGDTFLMRNDMGIGSPQIAVNKVGNVVTAFIRHNMYPLGPPVVSTTNVAADQRIATVDLSAGNVVLSLAIPNVCNPDHKYIKVVAGHLTNTLTITPGGGVLIENATSYIVDTSSGHLSSIHIWWDVTNLKWWII